MNDNQQGNEGVQIKREGPNRRAEKIDGLSGLNVIFDLHEVLIDLKSLKSSYEGYLADLLEPEGFTREEVRKIHDAAHHRWLKAFRAISLEPVEDEADQERFMGEMDRINEEWEQTVLGFVKEEEARNRLAPRLKTARLEFAAMAANRFSVYPDVNHVLTALRGLGARLHVASSASIAHVSGVIEAAGWRDVFDTITGYDSVRAPKKSKGGLYFRKLLERTGGAAWKTMFVGDSIEEARHAIATGMKFVMVARDPVKREDARKGRLGDVSFPVIEDLYPLPALARKLVQEGRETAL